MNFPRPPPAVMCLLPGPWQDSQPVPPASFAVPTCIRPCGLAAKPRVWLAWQSTHELSPVKVAPGISGGGARRPPSVEQEMNSVAVKKIPRDSGQRRRRWRAQSARHATRIFRLNTRVVVAKRRASGNDGFAVEASGREQD